MRSIFTWLGVGAVLLLIGGGLGFWWAQRGEGAGGALAETAVAVAPRICPPPLSIPLRGPGQPVDDILGVRPGLNIADIEALSDCLDPGTKIWFEPTWHTMVKAQEGVETRQIMHADRPGETITAGLVGRPGEERVTGVWRRVAYAPATAPDVASLEAELQAHFGAAHLVEAKPQTTTLIWAFDVQGLPLKADAGPGFLDQVNAWIAQTVTAPACAAFVRWSALDKPVWGPACGLTIKAEIERAVSDPTKAALLRVAVLDQQETARRVAAYRLDMGIK